MIENRDVQTQVQMLTVLPTDLSTSASSSAPSSGSPTLFLGLGDAASIWPGRGLLPSVLPACDCDGRLWMVEVDPPPWVGRWINRQLRASHDREMHGYGFYGERGSRHSLLTGHLNLLASCVLQCVLNIWNMPPVD